MTMVIAVKNNDSVIMTADKRITTSSSNGQVTRYSDDYKKISIIDNRFILSFAGRAFVAKNALSFINKEIDILSSSSTIEVKLFFREAFLYGKACFETIYLD